MKTYYLTAFETDGEKIVDERIEANNDEEAKKVGEKILMEKELLEKTHRLVSSEGKLLLFHV